MSVRGRPVLAEIGAADRQFAERLIVTYNKCERFYMMTDCTPCVPRLIWLPNVKTGVYCPS